MLARGDDAPGPPPAPTDTVLAQWVRSRHQGTGTFTGYLENLFLAPSKKHPDWAVTTNQPRSRCGRSPPRSDEIEPV